MGKRQLIKPFSFKIDTKKDIIPDYDNHVTRTLSSMKGQYQDLDAYNKQISKEDILLYEVYEKLVPELEGELIQGLSVVHPGKIGDEYFMTKGHFHSILNTAELYYCIKGHGYMLMETMKGVCAAKEMKPNTAVYVPGGYAHRSVNVDKKEKLVMLFCYPADAGHDYLTIEEKCFRKIMIEKNNTPQLIDNPKWS